MRPPEFAVGPFRISAGPTSAITGSTLSKVDDRGAATLFTAHGSQRTKFTLADITWSNGERDVRMLNRHESPQRFDRLVHGLRLGVHTASSGALRVDLRQAHMTKPNWAQLRQVTIGELHDGASLDVASLLKAHGADQIGSRAEMLGDTSTHRNTLCAIFRPTADLLPIVAYVTTRLIPVMNLNGLTPSDKDRTSALAC